MAAPPNPPREPSNARRTGRNQVMYSEPEPASSQPIPSLTQPQLATIQDSEAPVANVSPPPSPDTPSTEPEPPAAPAPRRARGLPMPAHEAEETYALPTYTETTPRPLPEPSLEDSKTMYVVSDIVDALRADAGYEPLPRDPGRSRTRDDRRRPSFWARLRRWVHRLRGGAPAPRSHKR